MKKIFLTSGVILCMACPAFATGFDTSAIEEGTPILDGNNEQIGTRIADGCVQPNLGVYSGSVTLRAMWRAAYNTITLDSNLTPDAGGRSAAPSPLYASNGSLWQGQDQSGTLTGQVSSGQTPFTTTPLGDLVDYTLHYNDSDDENGFGSTVATTTTTTAAHRGLLGFYYDDPNDDPDEGPIEMITAGGLLTAEGAAVSSNQTWTASWGSGTPTITANPTRDGYSFAGWNLSRDGTGSAPGAITADTDVYAQWTPYTYTFTYDCDDDDGGQGTPATGNRTATFDTTYNLLSNSDATQCGKAGYHFTGWDCTAGNTTITTDAAAGTGIAISGSTWTAMQNNDTISCVAHYAPNTVNLTWDVDGTTSNGTCVYDAAIDLPATPTKRGWDFVGWEVVTSGASEDSNLYNGE